MDCGPAGTCRGAADNTETSSRAYIPTCVYTSVYVRLSIRIKYTCIPTHTVNSSHLPNLSIHHNIPVPD